MRHGVLCIDELMNNTLSKQIQISYSYYVLYITITTYKRNPVVVSDYVPESWLLVVDSSLSGYIIK